MKTHGDSKDGDSEDEKIYHPAMNAGDWLVLAIWIPSVVFLLWRVINLVFVLLTR